MASHPVPFDPEIDLAFQQFPKSTDGITLEMLIASRGVLDPFSLPIEKVLASQKAPVTYEDISIAGPGGEIPLAVFRPQVTIPLAGPKRCIYYIHGGGMVTGSRKNGVAAPISWAVENDAVVISPEYRLAPEHQDPAQTQDCYAGLVWVAEHAAELGIDANAIMITGSSAGGGLAAGTALLARDLGGPKLLAQCLVYPMLDDRNVSISCLQYKSPLGTWTREANFIGWKAYLGDRAGGDDVNIYAAPGRATDLNGLPQTFIDVGSAEPFRDEDVAYASKLWAAGVQCELYVVPGGFHGYDHFAPTSDIARTAVHVRSAWVKRVFDRARIGAL